MFEFTDSGLILVDIYVNGTKTFTSANIKSGTFSVNRYSSSAVAPEFGNVTAGELIFSIDTTTVTPNISKGDIITATLYLSDDPTVTREVGDFIITNLTKGVDSLDVTCLDRMIELDGVADLTGVTYPITATNFINQVFGTGLGFTVNIDSGVYGAVSLYQPHFEEKITYRQVLSKVCECMGANAWYTDRLNIGWYKDTEEEIDNTTYIDCDLAETGHGISVEFTPDVNAIPVEITDTGIVLRVVNNPFMATASIQEWEANAQAIMQNIGNVTFYGASFTVLPMPELKPMDIVTIDNKLVPITSVTYGINENTKVESKIDEEDNIYNYDITRQIEVAKETAKEAEEKVDDLNSYFWHDNLGAHVSDTPSSTLNKNVLIDSNSVDIKDGSTTLASFGALTVVGTEDDGRTEIDQNGFRWYGQENTGPLFELGFDKDDDSLPAPYYTLGVRRQSSNGAYSTSIGTDNIADASRSTAIGRGNTVHGVIATAIGYGNEIATDGIDNLGSYAVTIGTGNYTKHNNAFAIGSRLKTNERNQTVLGTYNEQVNGALVVGNGDSTTRSNALVLGWDGTITGGNRINSYGGVEFNLGGATNPHTTDVTIWGRGNSATSNKIGIAVTNDEDNIQYGLQARNSGLIFQNWTAGSTIWNIYPNETQTKTVTATTNSTGGINLALNGATYHVLGVVAPNPYIAIPFMYTAAGGAIQNWARICQNNASLTPVANTNITVTVYYEEHHG